jgi:hypothetical protein
MSEVIYQQDITETECAECGEEKPLKYVKLNDLEMVACSSCFQDLVPREKSKYVKIESLPLRKTSIADIFTFDDGEDEDDEDFQLDNGDELENADNPSNSAHI